MTTQEETQTAVLNALRTQVDRVSAMPNNGLVLTETAPIIASLAQAHWALKADISAPPPDLPENTTL